MLKLLALGLLAAIATERGDVAAAVADQATLPADAVPHTFYISAAACPPDDRDDLAVAVNLMVASTTRQVVLERSIPTPLSETLSRIDLRDLKWSRKAWDALLADYPYERYTDATNTPPLVVRADWLLVQLADATEGPAYYELLLGETPATRDRWLELVGVDKAADELLRWGMIEAESGVAVNDVRWLENLPTIAGYAWGTRDSIAITPETDPLEHPLGDFEHDGEEWIVGLPKVSVTTGFRGVVQVYLLSDGDGNRVDKAPTDLVEDSTRFRGTAEIINPGSCVQCHAIGLNPPSVNSLRDYMTAGVELYAKRLEDIDRLQAFHFADPAKAIDRANEDFGETVLLLTGVSGQDAAKAFRSAIDRYDAELDLTAVAQELGVAPEGARGAIARHSGYGQPLGARVAGLVHGKTITREAFEERFPDFRRSQDDWDASLLPAGHESDGTGIR